MDTTPDANTSDALEQAVIERLRLRCPDVEVEAFPDNPEGYQLNHPTGALLVRYNGSKYGPLKPTDLVIQERVMMMGVTLVFRSLQGKEGVYAHIEAVRLALSGFAPPAFTRLYPVSDELIDSEKGLWLHGIDFVTTTTAVQEVEPDPEAVVTHITFNDGAKNAQIQVPRPD